MHLDPIIPTLVGSILAILAVAMLTRLLRQPSVIAYLIAGIVLGPQVLGLIEDGAVLDRIGAFGVLFLLFFVGMEISPRRLIANWKIAVIGTLLQIALSVAVIWVVGALFDWPTGRILLLGFVISLSSTAVVVKMLQEWGELESEVGQDVLGVLLMQDLAVIPMLIVLGLFGGTAPAPAVIALQVGGGLLMAALLAWVMFRGTITLPLSRWIQADQELQVFAALLICFALAWISGLFNLSAALGAFIGGVLIGAARETRWVHHSLEPFRVIFVSIFFVSIGMLLDLRFLYLNWGQAAILVALVLATNTFLNAIIMRMLGEDWRHSLYAGALLSQIGEFSFVLAALGLSSHIISDFGYQMTIAVIALSLLLSPAWIGMTRRILKVSTG